MDEDANLQWLSQFLSEQPQKRAPNARIVQNSEGRWNDVHSFLSWREKYLGQKLKAYQTRGGGTALPKAPETEELMDKVIQYLKSRNSKATNQDIKDHMSLSDEDWDQLKLEMKQQGKIASYRTRGGGVRLISPETSATIQKEVSSLRDITDEDEFCKQVEKHWAQEDKSLEFDYVFNIFGELKGSGKWDNPDIFALRIRSMEYVKTTKPCIIVGIETKLEFTRQAILQTYSYLRFCHYAYLVVNLTEDEILTAEDGLLAEYATELGIGVVGLVGSTGETASPFVEVIQPRAHIPTLSEVDRFLENHAAKFKKQKLELYDRYFGASLS